MISKEKEFSHITSSLSSLNRLINPWSSQCLGENGDRNVEDPLKGFSFKNVHHFGVINEYIISGYRPQLTYKKCIQSMFVLNNETVNIWTHLLGLVLFLNQMARAEFIAN